MESVLDNITVLYDQLFDAEKKIAKYIWDFKQLHQIM